MMVISGEEYREEVSERIEDVIDEALINLYAEFAYKFGFEPINEMCVFDTYYYGEADYAGKIRDLIIALFEECGMDVRLDEEKG